MKTIQTAFLFVLWIALFGVVGCEGSSISTFLADDACQGDEDCKEGQVCQGGLCVNEDSTDDDDVTDDDDDVTDDDDDVTDDDDDDDDATDDDDDDDDATDDDDDVTDDDDDATDDDDDVTDDDDDDDDVTDDDDDVTDDDDDMSDGDDLCAGVTCQQDDNPCTTNRCDPADGQCKPVYNAAGVCAQGNNPCMVAACDDTDMRCVETFEASAPCPQDNNPCTRHVCSVAAGSTCAPVPANEGGSCNDANACNGADTCQSGVCVHGEEIVCGDCFQCLPETGECTCDGSCGTCDDSGIRVELSWTRSQADLDLHFLRNGGDFEDESDCYIHNPNPDWGLLDETEDDPLFGEDQRNGHGEDSQPEVLNLTVPRDASYRLLVQYYTGSQPFPASTTVWVKVFYDGVMVREFEETLTYAGSYWNVACLNFEERTVTPITGANGGLQISVGDRDDINPYACMNEGMACQGACDCAPGQACVSGTCQTTTAVSSYCCSRDECPAGAACDDLQGNQGYCGFTITFNKNPAGENIGTSVNVENMFGVWGALFDTDRTGATVTTNSYRLNSSSQGNSCATRDSDGTAWKGNIHIYLVQPGENATLSQPVETSYASFYVGDTRVSNGLRVRAYSAADVLVYESYVSGDFMNSHHFVEVNPSAPMHHLRIDPSSDPDFTMDDLVVAPLYPAGR